MPIDPLDSVRKKLAEDLAKADDALLKAVDIAKDLSKALGDTTSRTKKLFEDNTQIKNALADTLDLSKRLGSEYVNIKRVTDRINANTTFQNNQQDKLNILMAEYTADMQKANLTPKSLSNIIAESQKILDLEKERDRVANKAKIASFEFADARAKDAEAQKLANAAATSINMANAASAATELTDAIKKQDAAKEAARLAKSAYEQAKLSLSIDEVRIELLNKNIEGLKEEEKQLREIEKNIEKGNAQATKMEGKAAVLAKLFRVLSKIPFLKEFMDFKKVEEDFKKLGTRAGFKSLGKELKDVFTNPLFLGALAITGIIVAFKALIKLAFDYDKLVTSIANNTGLSKQSSIGLLDNFRKISNEGEKSANALNNGFLSVKNQANALLELGDSLETNALFGNEMIQNQILLTKQMKMSKEEATGIQKMSLITGQSAEKILQTAMSQNKTAISYRKIFAEIANLNAEISTAYKNNPELIAKAVVEANKLGMSLEQTQKIASSLLNFESSISGELESELLLGKQLNFEKARALALDGKSAEAATEIMSQIGGINELTKMNVIQRERLASAIGMSAEELSKSAREQAVLNSLGVQNKEALEERYEALRRNGDLAGLERLKQEAANKEGGKVLLQDIARANLQERFAEAMERIKQIFTELAAGPMIRMVTIFAKVLEHTTALKVILVALAALAAAVAASMILTATAATIAAGGSNLIAAAAIGGTALVAGGLTAMAVYGNPDEERTSAAPPTPQTPSQAPSTMSSADMASRISQTTVDDAAIAPSPNNLIQTPGGNVKPNKNDSILLSTNPGV